MTGRITEPPLSYNVAKWRQIVRDLNTRFSVLEKTIGPYTVEGFTETRSLNMATATATDIGNFIATLVSDMQALGRVAKP